MRVRMKTTLAGPHMRAGPGDVIDVPKGEAYGLIEAGAAEQIDDAPLARRRRRIRHAPETAALTGGETPERPADEHNEDKRG